MLNVALRVFAESEQDRRELCLIRVFARLIPRCLSCLCKGLIYQAATFGSHKCDPYERSPFEFGRNLNFLVF